MNEDFTDLEITWGVKCYNGAWDSRTEALFKKQDRCLQAIRKVMPNFSVTYFPAEDKYMAFNNHQEISGWFWTRGEALSTMYRHLVKGEPYTYEVPLNRGYE